MPRKKKSDIEREQASSMVNDWEKANGGLDDNQRATLQRMIELNSNTAQQDIRRVDYYSGNQDKYEKNTQSIQVRNENTGNLVKKKKEIFALKEGQEEEPLENIYQNLEFDKNNEDHRKPPERNPFLDQIKAANSMSQPTSTTTPSRTGLLGFLDRTVGRFSKSATDVFFPGVVDQQYNQLKKEGKDNPIWRESTSTPDNGFETAADISGTMFGYLAPTGAAYKAVSKPIQLLTRGKELSGGAKLGVEAVRGATAGTALGIGEAARDEVFVPDEKDIGDHVQRIALNAAGGAILDPAFAKLGSTIKSIRKNKRNTSNVSDDVMQQERHQRELTNQAVEEQALQHTRIKNEPESLPIQAASESAPSLEQAIESVAKQKKKASSNGELPDDVQAMRNAPPVIQSAMAPDGRTITQKKLMDSFRDNVGITLRTGRMGVGDDAVSGIYKNSPEVIRTRDYGDLETLAHETGHHLDKKFGLNDPKFDDELMKLGSHTSGQNYTPEQIRQEGMAEFMRRYLLNPAMAEQEAPAFMKHFQNTIPEDVQKGLKTVQEDAQIWANQGDEARFRGKINVHEKPKGLERVKQVLQKLPKTKEEFYTEFVDGLYPISKAEKEILGGELADASISPYKLARLAAGTPKKAQAKSEEFLDVFRNAKANMDDIRDYVTATHARDLEKQGIKTGFTPDEIEKTITKFDNPEIQAAHQKIKAYNDSLLDMLVDGHMLSKDAVAAMREKHPNYMPFNRYFDEEGVGESLGGGKGFVDLTNPVKRIEGSSRNVIDPFESMMKNTFKSIQSIERNKVGIALADLAEQEGAGKWIEKLAGDGKESVGKENIVTVFRNGEKQQYQLAPELYRAMKAMDQEITNKIIRLAAKPSDALRAGATLTPEFIFRNPFRDQFAAYTVSDIGYNPFDFVKGLKEVGKKKFGKGSELYDDWIHHNGAYGGRLSADRDLLKEQLDGLGQQQKEGLQKAIQTITAPVNPKNWLKTLQVLSEVSEEATKVGAYQKGLKKGLTPEESAYQARELMDFNRMGDSMKSANRVTTFLNANVQGKDKLIRAMMEHPGRTLARIGGSTLPPTGLAIGSQAFANEKQKEIIDNMTQQERDTHWAYAVPGTDKVARVPKPFDISLLANTAERAYRMNEGDPYAFEGYGKTVWDTVKLPVMPTLLGAPVENMANYSFFRDGPIVPKRDQQNSPRNQYGPNTSLTAREIGDALNISPYKIDNLYKGYTAGLGQYPLSIMDGALSMISNKERPTPVAQEWNESTPGAKAFFVNGQGGGKVMEDYYNIMDEQQAIQADGKKNVEDASNEAEIKMLNKVDREMGKLRKEYYDVKSDTEMNPEVKRSELDRLDEEMRALAREGITIFRPDYK
ncbi:LPD38 domain-containing protein [Bacillus thuringiensis]|uniref:4'-phosphopantetheinyl transferase n=5 Tax=Bacillus thuringiensis TaxID=1428 RepID=A0A9X6QPD8_BACUH|nr:LPD38 domain-containing protein [Bacillus thuringiensis]OUB48346.1 4'-phosphopantetheinyl transferase [Bacillus thuringiensis serovar higo]